MNRYILLITIVFFLFSCKSSRNVSKQTNQQTVSQSSVPEEILDGVSDRLKPPTRFNGGTPEVEFAKYIASETVYPAQAAKEGISGVVLITFFIDVDGSVTDATVVRSVHPLLDAEALRVIQSSSKWTPGYLDGKPVKTRINYPIRFTLRR